MTDRTRAVLGFVIALATALLSSACDRRESHYAALSEVGDAVALGWLPGWITSDATNIREVHDLDTNRSCGMFTFADAGSSELANGCREFRPSQYPLPHEQSAPWWPKELTGSGSTTPRFRLMVCKERSADKAGQWDNSGDLVAVDDKARVAYFWRLPG